MFLKRRQQKWILAISSVLHYNDKYTRRPWSGIFYLGIHLNLEACVLRGYSNSGYVISGSRFLRIVASTPSILDLPRKPEWKLTELSGESATPHSTLHTLSPSLSLSIFQHISWREFKHTKGVITVRSQDGVLTMTELSTLVNRSKLFCQYVEQALNCVILVTYNI